MRAAETHLREARETYLKKTHWNIQSEWDVETNNREREMKRGQTQTEFSMYVQEILYFAVIHYSWAGSVKHSQWRASAGVTSRCLRAGETASLEADTMHSLIITSPVKHALTEMMDWYDMHKSLRRFLLKTVSDWEMLSGQTSLFSETMLCLLLFFSNQPKNRIVLDQYYILFWCLNILE